MKERKPKTLHVKRNQWPGTIYAGTAVIELHTGKRAGQIKVRHYGPGRPRFKRIVKQRRRP